MEPPIGDAPEEIRNEKVKALKSLRVMKDAKTLNENTIRAQYVASEIKGKKIKGYREEEGVDSNSLPKLLQLLSFLWTTGVGKTFLFTCAPPNICLLR